MLVRSREALRLAGVDYQSPSWANFGLPEGGPQSISFRIFDVEITCCAVDGLYKNISIRQGWTESLIETKTHVGSISGYALSKGKFIHIRLNCRTSFKDCFIAKGNIIEMEEDTRPIKVERVDNAVVCYCKKKTIIFDLEGGMIELSSAQTIISLRIDWIGWRIYLTTLKSEVAVVKFKPKHFIYGKCFDINGNHTILFGSASCCVIDFNPDYFYVLGREKDRQIIVKCRANPGPEFPFEAIYRNECLVPQEGIMKHYDDGTFLVFHSKEQVAGYRWLDIDVNKPARSSRAGKRWLVEVIYILRLQGMPREITRVILGAIL